MDEIVIGRKEILKALHLSSWTTVRAKKRKYPGFKKLIHEDPASGRPMRVMSEYIEYIKVYNKKN